jgi:hypothetical protein
MLHFPLADVSYARSHCAGWSIGEVATAGCCLVTGTNGENMIHAEEGTSDEAWW